MREWGPNTQHNADMAFLRRVFIVIAVGATLAAARAPDTSLVAQFLEPVTFATTFHISWTRTLTRRRRQDSWRAKHLMPPA